VPLVARVGTRTLTLDNTVSRDAGKVRFGGAYSGDLQLSRILRNSGDCPVAITAVALAVGSDYIIQSFSPATYRAGDNFSIGLFFVPTKGCRRDDTLLVFHDGAGSPVRIPVTGTGTEPSYRTLPRDTVDFGRVLLGVTSSQTLRLLNNQPGLCLDSTMISRLWLLGAGRLSFGVGRSVPPALFIPADGELTIPVTATPSVLGVTTAFIVIAHDVFSQPVDTVWLRVEGVRPELVSASAVISWGRAVAGAGSDSLLVGFLQNRGGVDAEIVRAVISGTDQTSFRYVAPTPSFTVVVNRSADLRVGFYPMRTGAHNARLTLDVRFPDASTRQIIVALSGTATSPAIGSLRNEIVYPTTPVNRCTDTTLVQFIYNRGTVPLTIRSIASRSDAGGVPADSLAFTVVAPVIPPTLTIAPGDSIAVRVRFCPRRPGYHQARLVLANNTAGPDSLFSVLLRGNGRSSSFTNVAEIRFAPTRVLTTRDTTVTGFLFNDQPGDLVIDSLRILGGLDSVSFQLLSFSNSFSIAPGRNVPVRLRFAPLRRGYHETFLYLYAAGSQTPYQVVLKGDAIYPYLTVVPADPAA
jgi:hypothetical protein